MGRVGLTSGIVIQEAVRLADQRGLAGLTMAALARRLSVALPSLYAHVRNRDQLRRSIAAVGSNELAVRLGEAVQGRVRLEALTAMCAAYRHFAGTFPGQYVATTLAPAKADKQHKTIAASVSKPIDAVVKSYDLRNADLVDAQRFVRATLHGFVSLENEKAFADMQGLDTSFHAVVDALDRALQTWPKAARPTRAK